MDVNKGADINPELRSRLVAKELNLGKREDLFAATPPLEAKKFLFSLAVTYDEFGRNRDRGPLELEFIDIKREFFHAKARGMYMLTYLQKMLRKACALNFLSPSMVPGTRLRIGSLNTPNT